MLRAALVSLILLAPPARAASIETVRLGPGFKAGELARAVPALAGLEPALAARIERSALALAANSAVVAAHDAHHLVLIPLSPGDASRSLAVPLRSGRQSDLQSVARELATHLQGYIDGKDDASAGEALRRAFDAMRPAKADRHIPFPDLAGMMAESLGLKRPARPPLKPLPPLPDAESLPRDALGTILMKMANRQNWGDVSYAASNITTVEGKIHAQWMYEDSKAEVREYLEQLSPRQREIVEAAWEGGLAETPELWKAPATLTLDWVKANFPSRDRTPRR